MQPRAAVRVPYGLRIEMGVMVDEPGCDDAPLGVDRAFGCGAGIFADPNDLSALNRHIGGKCRLARAIDDASVLDQQIIRHGSFSSLPRSVRARGSRGGRSPPSQWSTGTPLLVQATAYASPRRSSMLSTMNNLHVHHDRRSF